MANFRPKVLMLIVDVCDAYDNLLKGEIRVNYPTSKYEKYLFYPSTFVAAEINISACSAKCKMAARFSTF